MANKVGSKDQLRVLLQNTLQQVTSVLLNSSEQSNQYFYQNFTTISLKGLKYLGQYITLINNDQTLGKVIDNLIKDFANSLKQYKGRNIYIHSAHLQGNESNEEEDEIYHFMNTRNNLLPAECISNYENERQRKELEEFVEQISKRKLPQKESKRSLLLPKDNTFQLKIGRKTTFDPHPLNGLGHQNTPVEYIPFPIISENVETQTEVLEDEGQANDKKSEAEMEIASQCESLFPSEGATLLNISSSKLKTSNNGKKKEKKKLPNEDQKKKKAKFHHTNSNLSKDRQSEKNSLKKKDIQCSLKLVKINEPFLSLCSKQVDIFVYNSGDVSIAINFIVNPEMARQLVSIPVMSIPIILESNDEQAQNEMNLSKKSSNEEGSQVIDRIIENALQDSKDNKDTKSDKLLSNESIKSNSSKKYKIMKANPLYSNTQIQRIPTSSVRIAESSTSDHNESNTSIKEGQYKAMQGSRVGCMKKKRFTGERHLFQACHFTEGANQQLNASTHLRTSKISLVGQLNKKLSNEQKNASESLGKGNESMVSVPSQNYLKSRQATPQYPTEKGEYPYIIPRKSLETGKGIYMNGDNSLQSEIGSSSDVNRLIVISNQQKNTANQQKKDSIIFENNIIQTNLGKENTGEKIKHSYLKRNNLSAISQAKLSEDSSRSSQMRTSGISKWRGDHKSVDLSPNGASKSKFYRLSSQKIPSLVPLSKLNETFSESSHKEGYYRYGQSSSCHSGSFELYDIKRRLRNRGSKAKLQQYLQLVETMHQKLCGAECHHIKEMRDAKDGQVPSQLLRLLSRLK